MVYRNYTSYYSNTSSNFPKNVLYLVWIEKKHIQEFNDRYHMNLAELSALLRSCWRSSHISLEIMAFSSKTTAKQPNSHTVPYCI